MRCLKRGFRRRGWTKPHAFDFLRGLEEVDHGTLGLLSSVLPSALFVGWDGRKWLLEAHAPRLPGGSSTRVRGRNFESLAHSTHQLRGKLHRILQMLWVHSLRLCEFGNDSIQLVRHCI